VVQHVPDDQAQAIVTERRLDVVLGMDCEPLVRVEDRFAEIDAEIAGRREEETS
jgi:hypothetical protein